MNALTAPDPRSQLRSDTFVGRAIVVTGGGSGVGRHIAHELASLGADVAILGRTAEKLNRVAEEIAGVGGRCVPIPCDIRDPAWVEQTVHEALVLLGRIDGLVNNAGGQFPASLEETSPNGFAAVVRNNLLGTFNMMHEVHKQWMRYHGGAIVNITAGHHSGFPGMAHTGAARAGVANLTMSAAIEWGKQGVRVNEVAPGLVATTGLDQYEDSFQQTIDDMVVHIPLGRAGTPAEISGPVCLLLSPGAAFVSGACLRVDGGTMGTHAEWLASRGL